MKILITGASGYIGTRLISDLLTDYPDVRILNIDIAVPLCKAHRAFHRRVDILDAGGTLAAVRDFAPDVVIHLAADCSFANVTGVDDYKTNSEGVSNVLEAVKATSSVRRVVVTSTCFVCQPGFYPEHDQDYSPHTIYGQSKVLTERITREAGLECSWAIVRPGTIWGPGKWTQHVTMLKLMRQGRYWHPGRGPVSRPMGYIGNAVHIFKAVALVASDEQIDKKVFYACDEPTNLYSWVNACSQNLLGRPVKLAPPILLRSIAMVGDLIEKTGRRFPLTTFRYSSMTTNYLVPFERTHEIVGQLPYSMEAGVSEWITWYLENYES